MSDYRNRLLLVNYTFISSGVVTALLGIPVWFLATPTLASSHNLVRCILLEGTTMVSVGVTINHRRKKRNKVC